jgi:hypothetical protein
MKMERRKNVKSAPIMASPRAREITNNRNDIVRKFHGVEKVNKNIEVNFIECIPQSIRQKTRK